MDIVQEMRGFEIDHGPDGWPAVRMRQLGGTDNGGEMITGGFGTTMDLERGTSRQWVVGRDGVKRWADNGEPVEAPAEPAPIDEWAERCLGTWPQLQEHWKYMRAETKRLKRENSLLRQALTRAVALPMGQLPHGDEYFTTMLNGNVIVTPNAEGKPTPD